MSPNMICLVFRGARLRQVAFGLVGVDFDKNTLLKVKRSECLMNNKIQYASSLFENLIKQERADFKIPLTA